MRIRQYSSDSSERAQRVISLGETTHELERKIDFRRQRRGYERKMTIQRFDEPARIVRRELCAIHIAQFDQIGVRSISIVGITSLFIGMVLALQTAYSLAEFGGALFIGKVVSLSLVRELAPVLMALMVGGRVGSGIAAELGTMKVTEQIDALRALATNPVRKLVVPRVLATTLMFPLLTI